MTMRNVIQSMYNQGKLTSTGVLNSVIQKWITLEDANQILGSEDALEVAKSAKILEISKLCGDTITKGIDIELNGEVSHFNLSVEDQNNINNLFRVIELGGTEFPYQSDGGVTKIYSINEIIQIYVAAQTLITTQITYHNALKSYVQSLEDSNEILNVKYGQELPDPYASQVQEKLDVAKTQMNIILDRLSSEVSI